MKKIIEGKLYNTDTAKEMGCWSNMADYRNFSWYRETLYQKRTGEFFLHGEGGPMTQYARTIDQNSWSGGEKIMPLSFDAAREWAEKCLDADEYAQIFGMPGEDADDVTWCLQVPAALDAKVRQLAADQQTSLAGLVIKILSDNL